MTSYLKRHSVLFICSAMILSSLIISITIIYCNRYTYFNLGNSKIIKIDRYSDDDSITQFIILPYAYHKDDIKRDYSPFLK